MGIYENIKLALEGLKLNKMRAFLTMLGIIIGISSVIAIMTIGRAITLSVEKGFDDLSPGLMAMSTIPDDDGDWEDFYEKDYRETEIHEETLTLLTERFGDRIDAILKTGVDSSGTIDLENKSERVSIEAVSSGYIKAYKKEMLVGRFLNEEDERSSRRVIVMPKSVLKELYGDNYNSQLGKNISLNAYGSIEEFLIVGIYDNEIDDLGAMGISYTSNDAYIPYTTSYRLSGAFDFDTYRHLELVAADINDVSALADEIESFLNEVQFDNIDGVEASVRTLESDLESFKSMMTGVNLGIGGIAAISLLVGGIGVMNILLVSVVERTREIGIRKAIGAKQSDIRLQFLIEAIIICVIGGIFGIIFGGILAYIITSLMTMPTMPGLSSIIIAVGFSMAIGIFFGYYPANQAAKLDPIDALRYE